MQIDLNCDMGESFGRFRLGEDEGIMPFISSANIACGFHAGDPMVMRAAVRMGREHGVAIGAHPSWPDLQGFGRREMMLSTDEAEALVLYQIAALAGVAKAEGAEIAHVKPHGALYNQAAGDRPLAQAIARAVRAFDRQLVLVGRAGSVLIEEAIQVGLRVASEGFADRRYAGDGSLRSRKEPGAIIETPEEVAAQAVRLAKEGVPSENGSMPVDTLCLHGDHPRALENARLVRARLDQAGIIVRPIGH